MKVSDTTQAQEMEANAFAMELLMPEAMVREEAARIGVEIREEQCEKAARRLAQGCLFAGSEIPGGAA